MYGSIYRTFDKRQNHRDTKQINVSQGCEIGRWEQPKSKAQGIFQSGDPILYYTIRADIRHYKFVMTHRTWQHREP